MIPRALRRSVVMGGWGGDEFVVLLPDRDSAGSRRALETVARALKEDSFQVQGREVPVSFSAGGIDVGGGISPDEAIAAAAPALHPIKTEKARGSPGLNAPNTENPPRASLRKGGT